MTKDEALKQMLNEIDAGLKTALTRINELVAENKALKEALAQPEQEPVQYKCTVIDDVHPNGIPLEQWTSPPKREWVGLTAQEAADCWTTSATKTWHNFEAKLKEKNT